MLITIIIGIKSAKNISHLATSIFIVRIDSLEIGIDSLEFSLCFSLQCFDFSF